jgi:hypothetical protein
MSRDAGGPPHNRQHEESENCWCNPVIQQRCECDDGWTEDGFECCLCNGSGWIDAVDWGTQPRIIIHREDGE